MPFDAAEVARQIEQSKGGARAEQEVRAQALDLALRIYHEVDEVAWEARVQDTAARRWVGVPLSPLHYFPQHDPADPSYRVVATDSSFVAPDKHRGALCHLVNVGRVMIGYADQTAELDNIPNHYPEPPAGTEDEIGGRVLAAKCALRELEELYELARRYRATVALVDGSLMQLVNVLAKDEPVRAIMSEYLRILEAFERIRVPVVGYISKPASGMVMRAIRLLACEQETPHEQRPTSGDCLCAPLWSIDDSDLFWALLGDGELSPVFKATYRDLVGENARIAEGVVFAYLGTQYEVSRLEFPIWAMDGGLLERTVAAILHQCKLGQGYPNSLLLAHQYAVLHNNDRESYYFLLERAGLLRATTEKARGKRSIGQSI